MRVVLAALLLAGCGAAQDEGNAAGAALEEAAIARGVVRDPAATDIGGLYGRDTDQLCIVGSGGDLRIGASVDYGDEGCSASGTMTRSGESLRITFDDAPGCRFDARMDGDRIVFPGEVPAACEKLCTERASFAALEADLVSSAASEASGLRDRKDKPLCRS